MTKFERSVIQCIIDGKSINTDQRSALCHMVEREEEKEKARTEKREAFKQEIMEILEKNPRIGLTATDIQFRIPNFIERHISNQKVSRYLTDLVWDKKIKRTRVNCKSIYFCRKDSDSYNCLHL